ncbi:hypothetical protein KUH32_02250 [Thalassococcus sp. CAU 1522]|uniref:Uncharacterized protein n=1 Tax=Thalassococcus arenae TaxID=2851652 RepID=A0ABS6N3I3_9RHOB|nr:hypothetical protein [Thalassococcus arenae]MBV2358582.1 hypothetical protein [Thalassococcus arenae]
MEFLSILFALVMLGLFAASAILIGWLTGWGWGLLFALLVGLVGWWAASGTPPPPGTPRHGTNAFQRWASRHED